MKKFGIVCGLNLGLLSLFSFLQPVQSITLELLPQTQNVSVGDLLTIDVQIAELGEMEAPSSVAGFDFDLNYDPTILSFDSITFSGLIDLSNFGSQTVNDDPILGVVTFNDLSLDSAEELDAAQPSSFNLASLEFIVSGVSQNSLLSLTIVELVELVNEIFVDFPPVIPEDAIVSVDSVKTTVPEPNSSIIAWIIFLGLVNIYSKQANT